jgi:thiamine biosynthesis lipoprotein
MRVVRETRAFFGTSAQVMAPAYTDADARMTSAHIESAFQEIARIERLVDDRLPTSAIARVNASAGLAPVVVEPELFALIQEAVRVARLTQGAFDPTYAAFEGVWRFSSDDPPPPLVEPEVRADGGMHTVDAGEPHDAGVQSGSLADERAKELPPAIPDEKLRKHFAKLVNYRELVVDPAARTVFLRKPGMKIGLRGLVRGYALDRAAALLDARGVGSFVFSLGGDLVVRGDKEGAPWSIGIQDPRASGHFAALPMGPGAVMTSGDYEKSFIVDGVRYHHIIDPRTGKPADGVRSVTVVAGDGLSADALATAVFVLGPKEGLRLVERLPDTDAVIVTSDNKVLITKGLRERIKWRPPTDAP